MIVLSVSLLLFHVNLRTSGSFLSQPDRDASHLTCIYIPWKLLSGKRSKFAHFSWKAPASPSVLPAFLIYHHIHNQPTRAQPQNITFCSDIIKGYLEGRDMTNLQEFQQTSKDTGLDLWRAMLNIRHLLSGVRYRYSLSQERSQNPPQDTEPAHWAERCLDQLIRNLMTVLYISQSIFIQGLEAQHREMFTSPHQKLIASGDQQVYTKT